MTKKNKAIVIVLLLLCVALIVTPVLALRGAEFGGSDDAGSVKVAEITGEEYEPWFTPVFEQMLGGEVPGELESLMFCVQTGIGVGVIAFFLGRFVERKKQEAIREKRTEAIGVEAGRKQTGSPCLFQHLPRAGGIHRWGGRGVPRL